MAPEPLDISEHELLFKATDLSKLASIDLSQYLEAYMRNIRNLYNNSSAVKEMNFAEAAMVIQNSSIIFAKNVDSIWARAMNIRLALSANMNRKKSNDDEDDEDCDVGTGEEGADKQKEKAKKKKKRTFNVEEFKLLPFLNTDKNIDMKLDKKEDKLAKQSDKLVLPTSLRIKSKVNKSRDIFTPEGEAVGKMDEFRLFWPITKSGYLQEDYEPDDRCVFPERIIEQSFTEAAEHPVNEEIFNNDMDHSMMDGHNPLSPPPPTPPPTPPPMDLPMNDSPESLKDTQEETEKERECRQKLQKNPERENIVSLDKVIAKAWEPIPLDKGNPNRPLVKRRVYKLDTSDSSSSRKKKNRGKTDTESETFIVSEMFTKGKYYLNKGHGFDPWVLAEFHAVQMKRLKDAPNRKRKILEMLDAASEYEGDFYGFDDTEIDGGADFGDDDDDGDNNHQDNNVENIEVPLPAHDNAGTIFDGIGPSIWNENADEPVDAGDQYEAHALRTIQSFFFTSSARHFEFSGWIVS
ncbi:unnamed protein product [Bemisia tabaci]|uniref:Condensin II complex subunit H2 N-terminal domain-containing protein n=1 Tax=Bemisia tabaci TaxID=7038 RepID=A0A9P0AIS2_BEMTA|nr:unnamed protein product [Bemisia tabaci]